MQTQQDLEETMDELYLSIRKNSNRELTHKENYFFSRIKKRLSRYEAQYQRDFGILYKPKIK